MDSVKLCRILYPVDLLVINKAVSGLTSLMLCCGCGWVCITRMEMLMQVMMMLGTTVTRIMILTTPW